MSAQSHAHLPGLIRTQPTEVIFYYALQKDRSAFIQTTLLMVISSQLRLSAVSEELVKIEFSTTVSSWKLPSSSILLTKKSSAFLTTMSVLLSMSGKGRPFVSWSAFFHEKSALHVDEYG